LVSDIKGRAWIGVFENRVLRGIFGPKRHEQRKEVGETV
jgi:hypothetical protein